MVMRMIIMMMMMMMNGGALYTGNNYPVCPSGKCTRVLLFSFIVDSAWRSCFYAGLTIGVNSRAANTSTTNRGRIADNITTAHRLRCWNTPRVSNKSNDNESSWQRRLKVPPAVRSSTKTKENVRGWLTPEAGDNRFIRADERRGKLRPPKFTEVRVDN